MPNRAARPGSFKRPVVFRLSPDEWPLLEQAAHQHGSIQAALVAALHALTAQQPPATPSHEPTTPPEPPTGEATPTQPHQEITAREAARILGLKRDTVAGYIRSGRLPGHYRDTPGSAGWVTDRDAVSAYARRTRVG